MLWVIEAIQTRLARVRSYGTQGQWLVAELESPHCLSLSRFDIYRMNTDLLCVHSYASDIRTMLATAHFCPDLHVFLSFGQLGNSSFHS